MQTPNYTELTVHTKAQKYLDDLEAMLAKNWRIERVAEPGESVNVWPPKAKFCKWLKRHDGNTQQRASVMFNINLLDLADANLKGFFNNCPESFYQILMWLFLEAKERSLHMHLDFAGKQEVSPGQHRLYIRVDCRRRQVKLETLTAPMGRVARRRRLPLSAPRRRQPLRLGQLVYHGTSVVPHLQPYRAGWVAREAAPHLA